MATATAAAGTQAIAAPRAVVQAICRSDAPRARCTVSSADLRIATMRAASASTTSPAIARLTYSSQSSVSTACAVDRNAASGCSRAVLTWRSPEIAARSAESGGDCVLSLFSASYSAWAWLPW